MGPKAVASRTPGQAFAGVGSFQRRSPTGGCANGMFLKTATPSAVRLPRSWPVLIETIGLGPAAFAGVCAEIADIKACPQHRAQASMLKTLMDFIALPSFS